MRKYLFVSLLLFVAAIILPQSAKGQWTNPYSTYKTNGLIINSPKKSFVKSGKSKRGVNKKKVIRRVGKKRKVAAMENVIFPKIYDIALTERNYTVQAISS